MLNPKQIPPSFYQILSPYITRPYLPIQIFFQAHPAIHSLLSQSVPSLLLSSYVTQSSSPTVGPYTTAFIDAIESGSTVKMFMEDLMTQWDLGSPGKNGLRYTGWENFLGLLNGLKDGEGRLVVIDRAERLKAGMGFGAGGLGSLFMNLAAMTSCPVTVIFMSPVPWDYLRPQPCTFSDPIYMYQPAFSQQKTFDYMLSHPPISPTHPLTYHWEPFVQYFLPTAFTNHPDPLTLLHMAHALWPIWILPLLSRLPSMAELKEAVRLRGEYVETTSRITFELAGKMNEALRVALNDPTALPGSLARFTQPTIASTPNSPFQVKAPPNSSALADRSSTMPSLPEKAQLLLIASFLASFCPTTKDLTNFGRARWEGDSKRRKKPTMKKGLGAKIPQSLLGPKAFPMDRLIAIFGSLTAEYDDVVHSLSRDELSSTVGETMCSVTVKNLIAMLTSLHLLQRTSPADKLDGVMFKTGITFDEAVVLSRGFGFKISDYWAGDEIM
ncbi:Origin recognition complex, subunit 5 [Phaffia rhodozyma]|uniref:Origin recognition complex, subunit 5 n=1 Tax=Phaffia rhodozyma TaxID=264483 RepID=A0A0F7SJ38_PHARH|nr:Origin recognition complex, subunit 5 [Phaffia rhodozyma]